MEDYAAPVSDGRVDVRAARVGRGLFAARPYRTSTTIVRISGRVVAADLLWDVGGTFADNCFRFGPETYLDPLEGPGRYLNHSCAPNAGIRKRNNRLFLFAAGAIRAKAEIVIDYSTILGGDDIWTMRCKCGAPICRKTIRNFAALPASTRARYTDSGMVPGYVLDTL